MASYKCIVCGYIYDPVDGDIKGHTRGYSFGGPARFMGMSGMRGGEIGI